ncbi:MAG: ABC transporter ATP-binding protein [Acidobacteriota bacterium]
MSLRGRLVEAKELIRLLPWILGLLWKSHRGAASAVAVLAIVQALVPVAQLTLTKLLMDQIIVIIGLPAAERSGEPLNMVYMLLLGEMLAIVVGVSAGLLSGHARNVLQENFVLTVQQVVLDKSIQLDLEAYESPLYHDFLRRAQQQAGQGPIQLLGSCIEIAQTLLTLISIGGLVLVFKPWMTLILIATTLPSFWAMIHFGWRRFMVFDQRTPIGRRAGYLSGVLTSDAFAKEVRVWGIGKYLSDRVMGLHRRFRKENIELSRGQTTATLGGEFLSSLGYYSCYLVVILGVVAGRLTVGDMALYGGAFSRIQSLFERLLAAVANSYQNQLFARNLKKYLDLESSLPTPAKPRRVPALNKGIEVSNVGFTYPNTDRVILADLNFEIRAGECVALVGENGAGKTSLVKLLLRLYDPTVGQVLADGVDLRDLDPHQWRSQVGVVFQDYARFQLSVRENLGMGSIDHIEDQERIEKAAREAGVHQTILELPEGYDTLLGRQFEGGVELSLGQWQRLALARALVREAPFLIMDEPTAAMDAKSEFNLYRKMRTLAQDRMTLLISHRFSTVRMADRILVLEQGQVVEEGSHEELLKRDTRYAQMFHMQAEAYRSKVVSVGAPGGPGQRVAAG